MKLESDDPTYEWSRIATDDPYEAPDGRACFGAPSLTKHEAYIRALRRDVESLRARLAESERKALTFDAMRSANIRRLPLFKNGRGDPAHSKPDGSDWCLAQWCNAVCGELGEAANLIKKIERGDMTLDEGRGLLAKELADVATYLDILAFRAGVNLGEAVALKFNEVSARVGCNVTLPVESALTAIKSATREANP